MKVYQLLETNKIAANYKTFSGWSAEHQEEGALYYLGRLADDVREIGHVPPELHHPLVAIIVRTLKHLLEYWNPTERPERFSRLEAKAVLGQFEQLKDTADALATAGVDVPPQLKSSIDRYTADLAKRL